MKEYLEVLKESLLFRDIEGENVMALLSDFGATVMRYTHDEFLLREGDNVCDIGIVLSGHAHSIKQDASGRVFLIAQLHAGSFIGVLLAASKERRSPVSVQAVGDMSALFIPFERVLQSANIQNEAYGIFLRNCFDSLAEKALMLHDRIDCLLRPTARDKILAYLAQVSDEAGSRSFTIPFDRNAMAAYVNVERSALSRELSNMRRDGLIEYDKNRFTLL